MELLNWPICPKCGEEAVEMGKGEKGWEWSEVGPAKLCPYYHSGGNMAYWCPNGHKWELDKKGNVVE